MQFSITLLIASLLSTIALATPTTPFRQAIPSHAAVILTKGSGLRFRSYWDRLDSPARSAQQFVLVKL